MAQEPVRVTVKDLQLGMSVRAIVGLSAEYSYLDSRRVAMLKLRFKGARATTVRDGKKAELPIEGVFAGDQITSIAGLSGDLGFEAIDETALAFLREQGFREFLAVPGAARGDNGGAPPAAAGTAGPAAQPEAQVPTQRPVTRTVPTFRSAKTLNHQKSVAQVRYFLERVEQADAERWNSTETIKELFEQGRMGKYSMKPAAEAVEGILRKDACAAMVALAGLKSSDQTYAHCVDMSVLFSEAANGIIKASGREVNDSVSRSTLVAGFMHDIGKSKVPQEILDSTDRFALGSREMELMRSHVEHSAKILADAGADDAMINVAHYHHVKVDTGLPASYPAVDFAKVMPFTRLAAVVDVYQALTGKRSYKKNWVPGKAVQYLRELKGTEFDAAMADNFLKIVGTYPVGSLVRLSTGDLAFVTKVEGQPLERPAVALIENANGELLAQNPLVDLVAEPELSIVELLDHYEHYSDSIDQAFRLFKGLRVI